jgi:hypothetical protein
MAPISPDNTARFRFHYTTCLRSHTFQIRSSASPAALGVLVNNWLDALDPVCFAGIIDSVDHAVSGSNVFNPITTGSESHTWGTGAGTLISAPGYYNFIGRTAGGKRVRLAMFGSTANSVDYRFAPGENADLDAAVNVLQGAGSNIIGIDGLVPTWKEYINAGFNAYWQREVRP